MLGLGIPGLPPGGPPFDGPCPFFLAMMSSSTIHKPESRGSKNRGRHRPRPGIADEETISLATFRQWARSSTSPKRACSRPVACWSGCRAGQSSPECCPCIVAVDRGADHSMPARWMSTSSFEHRSSSALIKWWSTIMGADCSAHRPAGYADVLSLPSLVRELSKPGSTRSSPLCGSIKPFVSSSMLTAWV